MDSPSYDALLGLCRDQHRRIVLGAFAEEERPLTLRDLTNAVLANNHHVPITEASDEDREEVRCLLYHAHLPKLEAAGLIEYDQEREVAEPTEQFDRAEPTLSRILAADSTFESPAVQ